MRLEHALEPGSQIDGPGSLELGLGTSISCGCQCEYEGELERLPCQHDVKGRILGYCNFLAWHGLGE